MVLNSILYAIALNNDIVLYISINPVLLSFLPLIITLPAREQQADNLLRAASTRPIGAVNLSDLGSIDIRSIQPTSLLFSLILTFLLPPKSWLIRYKPP